MRRIAETRLSTGRRRVPRAPIIAHQRVLATVGMTCFTSALDRAEVIRRHVPLLKGLAGNIAASVASLQE